MLEVLEILRNIVRTHLFILHINQTSVLYGKKHGIYFYISRTTQHTNTGQVPACSQEPVDFTDYCGDFNLFEDNTARNDKFHPPIID